MRSVKRPQPQIMVASLRPPTVERVDGTTITFRVYYNIVPELAIRYNALQCKFQIKQETNLRVSPPILSTQDSFLCYYTATDKKNSAIEMMRNSLANGNSDLTAFIPNDSINAAVQGKPIKRIRQISTFQPKPGAGFAVKPMSSFAARLNTGNREDANTFGIRRMSRDKKDPAADINRIDFHVPIKSIMSGVSKLQQLKNVDPKLGSFANSQAIPGSVAGVVSLTADDITDSEASFTFSIDKSQLGTYSVTLKLTVGGNTSSVFYGAIIQDTAFSIDLLKAYSDHTLPVLPPVLQISDNGPVRLMTVKQRDRNASSVEVYRRDTRDPNSSFVSVASVSLLPGQEARLTDRPEKLGQCVYRAVAVNEYGAKSGIFESRVMDGIKALRISREPERVSIMAYEDNNSIRVRVFNIPTEVSAVTLIRRNITLRRSPFEIVVGTNGRSLVSNSDSTNTSALFQDFPTRSRVTYEYKVRLTWKNGVKSDTQLSAVVNFIGDKKTNSAESIIISQQNVKNTSVSFDIQAPRSGQTIDLVIQSLKSAGIDNLYLSELEQNRDRLSDLIAFEVLRFDKVTGQQETFGVVSPGLFIDDESTQAATGVGSLVRGHDYVYQVRLLVRSVATIFKQSQVQRTGQQAGKDYVTSARKFLSPNVLNRATLASNNADAQFDLVAGVNEKPRTSDDMIAGSTSLVTVVEAKISPDDDDIGGITVELGEVNIVRWNITDGTRPIDHIVIHADYNGVLAPLEALHFTGSGQQVYKDTKLSAAAGTLRYYVQIVYADFTRSALFGPAEEI